MMAAESCSRSAGISVHVAVETPFTMRRRTHPTAQDMAPREASSNRHERCPLGDIDDPGRGVSDDCGSRGDLCSEVVSHVRGAVKIYWKNLTESGMRERIEALLVQVDQVGAGSAGPLLQMIAAVSGKTTIKGPST